MWATERPDGGRGFGVTGSHYHSGWGHADHRTLMRDAILWLAKIEIPANGVESTVTEEDMKANLDAKPARHTEARPKSD